MKYFPPELYLAQQVFDKAAMDAAGLYGGPVRAPLAPLSDQDRERVNALVRSD